VRVDVPETLPEIVVDAALLERALANLIDNALSFSSTECPVRVTGEVVGDHVHLRVIDHGPGIAAGDRARVFQPFQRLGDKPNGEGVGLGLAVAHGFVEAIGGEITVEDTPGGGCTMVVSLPLANGT
jgi:two-component system sensor histidine kinase KdpD